MPSHRSDILALHIFYQTSVGERRRLMPRLQTLCRVCWLRKERLSPPATRFHTSSRRDVYLGPPKELSPRVGPKRRRKVQAAQRQWDQKARRISNGTEPSMLKILEDRGYVKEIAGLVGFAGSRVKGISVLTRF